MYVFAVILAAAMATATPHSMMQGHAKASPHPMHTSAMQNGSMHSSMHNSGMHGGVMKNHTPKPHSTPR